MITELLRRRFQPEPVDLAAGSFEFPYDGLHGAKSHCLVKVVHRPGVRTVVLITESPDNPGTSVTNMIESLIEGISIAYLGWINHDLEPIFIEHYPSRERFGEHFDETFDWVRLNEDGHPKWQGISRQQVELLMGVQS